MNSAIQILYFVIICVVRLCTAQITVGRNSPGNRQPGSNPNEALPPGGTATNQGPTQRQPSNIYPNINNQNNRHGMNGVNVPGMFTTTIPPNKRHLGPNPRLPSKPSCRTTPCQNMGTCTYNQTRDTLMCVCKPLFIGEFCEHMIKAPKYIQLKEKNATQLTITWKPPETENDITGYIVQFHRFGNSKEMQKSALIHPSVLEYTLRDLEANSKYTVCVNLVIKNITDFEAVLRDQCLEVKTTSITKAGLPVPLLVIIIGVVFAVLIVILVIAITCQRWRLESKENIEKNELGTYPSTSWRKSVNLNNQHIDFCQQNTIFPQYADPHTTCINQTNNANSDLPDDVFFPSPKKPSPQLHPHQFAFRSSSVSYSTNAESRTERLSSFTSANAIPFHLGGRHKRTSSVPQSTFRELPPSISNHMMRSPTTRDKDATSEFDMSGSYFLPRV